MPKLKPGTPTKSERVVAASISFDKELLKYADSLVRDGWAGNRSALINQLIRKEKQERERQ